MRGDYCDAGKKSTQPPDPVFIICCFPLLKTKNIYHGKQYDFIWFWRVILSNLNFPTWLFAGKIRV